MTNQPTPGVVKPGWTTTEFWQTLLVQALTAIVAIGTMFRSNFNLDGVQAVVPAVAVLAAALAQAYYSHSRAVVKAAAQSSAAVAANSPVGPPPENVDEPVKGSVAADGTAQRTSANPAQQPTLVTFKGPSFEIGCELGNALTPSTP
jgi:hypothetical protein